MTWLKTTLTSICLAGTLLISSPVKASNNDAKRTGFTITFDGITSDLSVLMTSAVPA